MVIGDQKCLIGRINEEKTGRVAPFARIQDRCHGRKKGVKIGPWHRNRAVCAAAHVPTIEPAYLIMQSIETSNEDFSLDHNISNVVTIRITMADATVSYLVSIQADAR